VVAAEGPGAASPIRAIEVLGSPGGLATARADGSVSIWLVIPRTADAPTRDPEASLREVRTFASPGVEAPTPRPGSSVERPRVGLSVDGRKLAALRPDGRVDLFHASSGFRGSVQSSQSARPHAVQWSSDGEQLLLLGEDGGELWDVADPHAAVSLRALFGRSWYSGYPAPRAVWQSSGGSEGGEAKLALTPLLAGSAKAAFYALLFALPLAVLAALYTSQFIHSRALRWIRPTLELMAALPTVVLGLVASLWLAPRLERWMPALVTLGVAVPVTALVVCALPIRRTFLVRRAFPGISPALARACVVLGVAAACVASNDWLGTQLFDGSFGSWLYATTGRVYEPQNTLLVGLALGFAVIPIVFSLSDEAFANAPRDQIAASLALGATRWQTIRRIVLPASLPGLLGAVMIGASRAIGETMVVLLVAGNTPLIDLDPFDGLRAVSANLAIEIPHAAQGSTLYRTLCLSALLLFAVTFALNAVAELLRQRIRRRRADA